MSSATPVVVLTGALGAGKTTFLGRALHADAGAGGRSMAIVNDVAEFMPDDVTLPADSLRVVTGGCSCCAQWEPTRQLLMELAGDVHRGGDRLDRLYIELSGVADASAFVRQIESDPVLQHNYRVVDVVACVDALALRAAMAKQPLAGQQLQAASALVLAKTDLVDEATARDAVALLKGQFPVATITVEPDPHGLDVATVAARVAPELFGAHPHQSPPVVDTITVDDAVSWPALVLFLSALLDRLGSDVIRLKGQVHLDERHLLLNAVHGVMHDVQDIDRGSDGETTGLVIVTAEGIPAELHALWQRLTDLTTPVGSPRSS